MFQRDNAMTTDITLPVKAAITPQQRNFRSALIDYQHWEGSEETMINLLYACAFVERSGDALPDGADFDVKAAIGNESAFAKWYMSGRTHADAVPHIRKAIRARVVAENRAEMLLRQQREVAAPVTESAA